MSDTLEYTENKNTLGNWTWQIRQERVLRFVLCEQANLGHDIHHSSAVYSTT